MTDIMPVHHSCDALLDAASALARTIELDRACQEALQQLRRVTGADALVIALLEDATGELRPHSRSGYDESDEALAARLRPRWRDAIRSGAPVVERTSAGSESTAPIPSAHGALGAITMRAEPNESPQWLDDAGRVLEAVAAQTAVAVERAGRVRRLEESRRLEGIAEVATGIAHELRNPLFGISSAAQLLRFRSREDPVVERNVGRILREVERLNGLVADLLEYGRPRALSLAPADPDAIWDEVLEGNRGLLESRSLGLDRERAAPPVKARVDAALIAQLFLNLLANAAEAAPPGTDLALASTRTSAGGWRCTLRNDGPPIPADVLPRVFEIFFSTKQGGTGIGLALCQRVIDEHGGTIAIDSSAPRGTTLTITLPPAGATKSAGTSGEAMSVR
jgi:signal transduction histidine kinase